MTPENKIKRTEIIKKIGQAEKKGNILRIRELGQELMSLEEMPVEKRRRGTFDLTVPEYWSYYMSGFQDNQIADICDVAPSTIAKFKIRNNIKTPRGLRTRIPQEVIDAGY